jgi:hypothetical protein
MSEITPRHVRHRKRSRIRRSKDFKAFLSGLQATLNATGATVASWTAVAPVALVAAAQTLTATAIADGDTVTIGSKVYTFQTTLTAGDGHVHRTGTLATDLGNLAKAINLNGVSGTDYAAATTKNTQVSATADATHVVATALVGGTAANSIATTETSGTAAWGNTTLLGGVDAVAASSNLAKATHGLKVGDGPFLATNSGGALPTGCPASTLLWVAKVPDSGHFGLATGLGDAPIVFSAAGSGTNTLTKASSLDAIYAYLKKHGAPFMKAATDVDAL